MCCVFFQAKHIEDVYGLFRKRAIDITNPTGLTQTSKESLSILRWSKPILVKFCVMWMKFSKD